MSHDLRIMLSGQTIGQLNGTAEKVENKQIQENCVEKKSFFFDGWDAYCSQKPQIIYNLLL